MLLVILFHFLCVQHVSDINISIIRSLRLFCWITILVVLILVRCVLGDSVWLGWSGIRVAGFQPHRISNTHRTKNNTTNVVIQQNSRELLMMDILMSETCWAHKKWNKIASNIKLAFYSSTIFHATVTQTSLIPTNCASIYYSAATCFSFNLYSSSERRNI